jgi:high frequency lysogenization protein
MSINTFTNQVIALAGITQATQLVHDLASTGSADASAFRASVASLLKIDSSSVIDVFGNLAALKLGLEKFQQQIAGYTTVNPEQARYAASLIFLERQLVNQEKMLKTIRIGVAKAQAQADYFDLTHENILANLGDVYYNTISTLQPRIMVNGDEAYLSRPEIVNKIRTLLLAGIRATVLWRQCGGARWKVLFYRKRLHDEATFLLTQI